MDDFWADAEVIASYTRAQGIEDGVLIDASMTAAEIGFRWPVALTQAAYAEAVTWDTRANGSHQDAPGRLWDVLYMAHLACRRPGSDSRRDYQMVRVPNRKGAEVPEEITLSVHIGPGDTAEPVITILLPHED